MFLCHDCIWRNFSLSAVFEQLPFSRAAIRWQQKQTLANILLFVKLAKEEPINPLFSFLNCFLVVIVYSAFNLTPH